MSSKKAKVLEAEDIYNHFKAIGAYKEKLLEEDKSIATASCKDELINAYDNQGFEEEEKLVKQEEMALVDQGVEQNNQVNICDVLQMLSLIYLTVHLNLESVYQNYHYAVDDDVQELIGDNLSSNNSDFMFGNSHMICCTA
jgi:molybdopterin converting factor small subunit